MVGPNRQTTKDTKSQEENASWSTQIMVVYHENHARYGPILTAGVLLCLILKRIPQISTKSTGLSS